jgi:hypothetical protein
MSGVDRLLKITLIGLGVACALLYGFLLWNGSLSLGLNAPSSSPSPNADQGPDALEIWDAYQWARSVAREDYDDVVLVSASTQWQTADKYALLNGTNTWSFVFYSPGTNKVLDVVVGQESAKVVNQTRVWEPPTTLDEGSWRAGPQDALLVFLAEGGESFLDDHAQSVVDVHLSVSEAGESVWGIAALAPENRDVFSIRLDAKSLAVLSRAP